MSPRYVLDSQAVIAFLEKEPGWERVAALLGQARDTGRPLALCVVNWGEICHVTCRGAGEEAARRVVSALDTLPIEIVPADRELTRTAAGLKASRKMSYADCFAAALALSRKSALVTGDREFKGVEGKIKIEWL